MKNFAVILWLASGLVFGGWVGWMRLDNVIPYEYTNGQVVPNPAREGQRVVVQWDIKVHRLCPGTVQRSLIDDTTEQTLAAYDPTPASQTVRPGDTQLRKSFVLIDDLPQWVRYEAEACFQCNKLQKFFPLCKKLPPIRFEVIQPDARR